MGSTRTMGAAVLVSIGLNRTIIDRLIAGSGGLPPLNAPTIRLDGAEYRIGAANANEAFPVRTPRTFFGANLGIDADTISVGSVRHFLRSTSATSHLTFYEMDIETGK